MSIFSFLATRVMMFTYLYAVGMVEWRVCLCVDSVIVCIANSSINENEWQKSINV